LLVDSERSVRSLLAEMKCHVCVCIAKLVVNFNDFQENLPSFLSFLQLMGEESLRTRKSPENDVTNIQLSMSGFRKHPYPPPRKVIENFKWEGDSRRVVQYTQLESIRL